MAKEVAAIVHDLSTPFDPVLAIHTNDDDNSDQYLNVVVTSVDAVSPSVTQSIASSLSSATLDVYTVEFVVTKGTASYCIKRPLPELINVLTAIQAAAPEPQRPRDDASKLPEFPPKNSRHDSLLAQWCARTTTYLATHRCGMLNLHPDWLNFVTERDEDKGARMHMTAVDFILQPFLLEKCHIPRGSRHELVMSVKGVTDGKAPQYIVWKFDCEDFDIEFSVSFAPDPYAQPVEIVHARTKYLSTSLSRAVEGSYRCIKPGNVTLVWDNSYSRLRGKTILYQVQVVSSSIMESAIAAADALDEAVQAEKARDEEQKVALSTALIVSPEPPSDQLPGFAFLPEAIAQQSWLLSTPINVAGHLAWKLFGSQEDSAVVPMLKTQPKDGFDTETRNLLEELNGLNMQLMKRMESLEDSVAKLTTERDQERSKTHMAIVEKENLAIDVKAKDHELASIGKELERIQRERQAWREIQVERDALLEEKHRWAMTDEFDGGDGETSRMASEMDIAARTRLEQELGQAEASVLRCRAELGYPLNNHLTGTSARLEKVAREMTATKQQFEEQMQSWEHERLQLRQDLVKARGQRRVLVTELRNMRTQTEGQIAVAMAEASEARMVNQRLKKQNELLLTQTRSLVIETDDSRTNREHAEGEEAQESRIEAKDNDEDAGQEASVAMLDLSVQKVHDETRNQDESPVPYTLNANDIALLNGRLLAGKEDTGSYRARLEAFFQQYEPEKLVEVDEMLANYQGVEESLFESLALKYCFVNGNQ